MQVSRTLLNPSASLCLILCLLSTGCQGTRTRNLKITEVGRRVVEMVNDEPSGSITMGGGYRLLFQTSTGTTSAVDLGLHTAPIPAGGYFAVWSQSGYSGPIVAEAFAGGQQGAVPGIKVPSSFFSDSDVAACEVRLTGSRSVVSQLILVIPLFSTHRIDDVVRFGQPPGDRPVTGGSWTDAGTLNNPSGSTSLARFFNAGRPTDTDHESDWRDQGPTSWGVPTQ